MKIRFAYIFLALLAAVFASCVYDDGRAPDPFRGVEGIRVTADIALHDQPSTRADVAYNITQDYYNCDFHLRVGGSAYTDVDRTESAFADDYSTYVIPSGFEGALIPKVTRTEEEAVAEKTLNWFSRDLPHDFWGWTFPQDPTYRPKSDDLDGIPVTFENTDLTQTVDSKASEWQEGVWGNGRALEQMIGAHTGPVVYVEDGIYVPLHFKHLVSKVFLKEIRVIDNYNNVKVVDSKGIITFYGMPSKAKLYPSPVDENGANIGPLVVADPSAGSDKWEYDYDSRVRYAITNNTRKYYWEGNNSGKEAKDCWYICPELDFSQMEYKIELYAYDANIDEWVLDTSHGRQGAYYGDFSKVEFKREGKDRYDDPDGGDETILHAGEYLELTFYLYERGNPSVQGTITRWTQRTGTGSSHVQQGIYSYDQLKEMTNMMKGGDEKALEEFYEMNGSGRDTGSDPEGEYPDYEEIYGKELKIIELFDEIGSHSYGTTNKVSSLEVADGYILDGQGHTVNVSSATLTIGAVRDIYLKYYPNSSSTASILYIDKNGDIWKIDHFTFVPTPTGYNINDAAEFPCQLTMNSGKVTPSK